jgi:hypothetical protein
VTRVVVTWSVCVVVTWSACVVTLFADLSGLGYPL